MTMLGQLIPCGGGDPIPLKNPVVLLGRSRKCDVPVRSRRVSSQHCVMEFRDARWFVRDLDSHNGIRINGDRCRNGELGPDSVLSVGDHQFVVRYMKPGGDKSSALQKSTLLRKTRPEADTDSTGDSLPVGAGSTPPRDLSVARLNVNPRSPKTGQRPAKKMFLGKLTPCGGGDPVPLMSDRLLLGRRSSCDIVVRSSRVSGKHCELWFRDGWWYVQDLDSRHGIMVDEIEYDATFIRPGQILSIANVRFEIDYIPRSEELPPEDINPFERGLLEKAGLERAAQSDVDWMKSDQNPDPDERIDLEID